jgi:Flp pilus assembly protein TadD
MNAGDYGAARASMRKALELDPGNPRILLNLEILAALNPSQRTDRP